MTQQDRVYFWIKESGGSVNTNDMRGFGRIGKMADVPKRCRELFLAGYLTKRWIEKSEKIDSNLLTDIMVYEINAFLQYPNLLDKDAV